MSYPDHQTGSGDQRRPSIVDDESQLIQSGQDSSDVTSLEVEHVADSSDADLTVTVIAPKLERTLTVWDGLALVAGIMIGSGIFASPGVVLHDTGSTGLSLLTWIFGGCLSIVGALCYAELGTCMPNAGGESIYLEKAYGRAIGFSFAFSTVFVLKPGSHATMSIIFSRYLGSVLFNLDIRDPAVDNLPSIKALACACIIVLNGINSCGVRWGAFVQKSFLVMKLLAIALVLSVGLYRLGDGMETPLAFTGSDVTGFGSGMIAALWAYDGWNNLNYVSEELIDPNRNLFRVIVGGVCSVTTVYALVNMAYFIVLSEHAIIASRAIAVDFVESRAVKALGPVMAVFVSFSAFGACNGSILTGGRQIYAYSRDGHFPKVLATLSANSAPYYAHLLQTVWACLLVIPFDYVDLVNFFGSTAYVFYGATGLGLIFIRRKYPNMERPYRVAGYPFTPIGLFLVSCVLVLNAWVKKPVPVTTSLCFIALSFPVYYLRFHPYFANWRRRCVECWRRMSTCCTNKYRAPTEAVELR